ncbi:RIB43A-like with coiled-coils protein 1 [Trichomycterus rosablanca]|uniref:RIB43A-like with coiled-coils protein 1 n=1 Tax=Trichomycterus rosablanca TaxID=2290929 RepID=UPI002F3539E2
MFKVDVSVDDGVLKAVERRRDAEVERKKRVFSTRNRIMGLDMDALEKQVTERCKQKVAEHQREKAYDALSLSIDQMLLREQKEVEEKRRELAQELVKFRALYQRDEDSRDADLNYKFQGAANASVNNSEMLGPASMQIFQGEGVGEDERKRAQMEQNEKMLRAQKEDRERREREKKHKELLKEMELVQQDLRVVQLDALEEECIRAACMALKSYNQAQTEERQVQERQDKLKQKEMNMLEVMHTVTSDLLTECPEVAEIKSEETSRAPRVVPDRWKGMSSEQLSAIYRQREEQCADKQRQRQLERQRELVWGLQQLEQARQQEEEEKRVRELERERRARLDQYNQHLAKEQQKHQQYLNNELYTNQPSVHYFTQFSTSSR